MRKLGWKRRHWLLRIAVLGLLLGIHDGHIALWDGNDPEPIRVFPYRAELLPAADQAALEKGIVLDSVQELRRLLQDYLS